MTEEGKKTTNATRNKSNVVSLDADEVGPGDYI